MTENAYDKDEQWFRSLLYCNKLVVVFHKDCVDGIFSYFAAKKAIDIYLDKKPFSDCCMKFPIEVVGFAHDYSKEADGALINLLGELTTAATANLLFVDHSPSNQLLKLIDTDYNNRCLIIDHHTSAEQRLAVDSCAKDYDLEPVADIRYYIDTSQCGASLVAQFFNPYCGKVADEQLLAYVEDRDLFNNKLKYTEEVSAYLRYCVKQITMPLYVVNNIPLSDTKSITHLIRLEQMLEEFSNPIFFGQIVSNGQLLNNYEKSLLSGYLDRAAAYVINEHTIYTISAPHNFASDIAKRCDNNGFVVIYDIGRDSTKISLRCNKTFTEFNLAKAATHFGGGGHVSAAGFIIENNKYTSIEDLVTTIYKHAT